MAKKSLNPGTLLCPVPAVMVSCGSGEEKNIITIGWTGIVNTNPPMTYVSVRKSRHSHHLIEESGEFVINVTTEALAFATDYCGVKSGRDVDKFKEMNLTPIAVENCSVPAIKESPVSIECKVRSVEELGSHHMFLADVVAVHCDDAYMDEKGGFHLEKADPLVYSHGQYYATGDYLGKFGYSIQKKK